MPKKPKVNRVLFLQAFPLWGCGSGIFVKNLASETNKHKNLKTAIVCPESEKTIKGLKIYPLELPFTVAFTGHPEWPVCKLYKDLTSKEISQVFNYFLRSTIRAVEEFKPDLIHVHHASLLLWVANFIKALYGINFVVTSHGTGILTASEDKRYIPLSRDALSRTKKIIAVSKNTKDWLLETFSKEYSYKTRIIPGGIHIEDFPPEKKIKVINKKYKLKGKKVVLFSGKLTSQKGVDYLIKAAPEIKGDVYIIGDGPEKKNLEDLAYKMKLDNVHFLGYMGGRSREELIEFLYRANVMVVPSIWSEPMPLSVLEALSCKNPVVATRKGGLPSAIKNGVNGLLIRPRSSKQIAEACNKILGNKELEQKLGNAARQTVEEKFTWKEIAKKYTKIYNKAYANGNNKKKVQEKKKAPPKKKKHFPLSRLFRSRK